MLARLFIDLNIEEDLLLRIINKSKDEHLTIEQYVWNLLKKDMTKKIFLKNEFYFDTANQKLFKNGKEILLSRKEYALFKLFLDNANQITTIEDIKSIGWNSENVSIFAIRNFILKLRTKIYPELIKNKSNTGYMLVK
jgi:DNA-binding response OmpR family regulator